MSKVTNSIGDWFEDFISYRYSDLWYTGHDNLVPDFFHADYFGDDNWRDNFWIEAKVGNVQWGCRIKDYQIDAFDKPGKSIVYALGMHDFDNANARLTQVTKRGRKLYLERHANVLQLNFITDPFMNRLYSKESRMNARETIEYCMIKPSVLNNVFENREFTREAKKNEEGRIVTPGRKVMPESFYRFNYGDYSWFEGTREDGLFVRAILHPERDGEFIDYFNQKENVQEHFYV